MWKYRYRREHLADDLLVDACNDLGEEGWSLVGAPRWDRDRQRWACFFKRTISNREQAYERMHRPTTPEEQAEIAAWAARWRAEGGR
jgi:hypothetical protein